MRRGCYVNCVSALGSSPLLLLDARTSELHRSRGMLRALSTEMRYWLLTSGPYLGFFVWGQTPQTFTGISRIQTGFLVRRFVFTPISFPGGGNCPPCPPAMYGPEHADRSQTSHGKSAHTSRGSYHYSTKNSLLASKRKCGNKKIWFIDETTTSSWLPKR